MLREAPPFVDHAEGVITDERLHHLAQELTSVPGVVGVMLGGSRSRGDHTPESDVDLGLYYRPPLDVPALQALAQQVAGPTARLSAPGDWGPWVDGGGWLRVEETAVDWIYRDLNRVHECWAAARAGRYTFHAQVGHPLGVPDFAYAGEVALGIVLADPSRELGELQEKTRAYPPALSEELIAGLWEAEFTLGIAEKAATRGDTTYVAGCLFRAVLICAHALHGRAERWLVNEKGAIASAARLPGAPDRFFERAHAVLAHLGAEPHELTAAIVLAAQLLRDTAAACDR